MLPSNFRTVILSRKRSETIAKHTLKLMPWAEVTVDEEEVDDYAKVMDPAMIVPHPHFATMADLRNWIDDQTKQEFLYHVHDDLFQLRCLVGWHERRYNDPMVVAQLLERTAICARDAGAFMFGFGNIPIGTAHYDKMRPFKLNAYVRNVMGFRRGHGLRWDPVTLGHHDVDVSMESLLQHRIIWRDERWTFDDSRLASNRGGMAGVRTHAMLNEGRRNMIVKWGPRYVKFKARRGLRGATSSTEATIVTIRRRDPAVKNR